MKWPDIRITYLDGEEENPINSIKGKSVGEWLGELLRKEEINVSNLGAEDWGWYSYATYQGNKYLIGFVAYLARSENEVPEIIIQVDKRRSLFERVLGKNKLTKNDSLLSIIERYIKGIDDVANIEVLQNA